MYELALSGTALGGAAVGWLITRFAMAGQIDSRETEIIELTKELGRQATDLNAKIENRDNTILSLNQTLCETSTELEGFRKARDATRARLAVAGRKGADAANAKKRAKRLDAAARTLAAITPMRSRAKVVAPVKARRTRAKKAAQG